MTNKRKRETINESEKEINEKEEKEKEKEKDEKKGKEKEKVEEISTTYAVIILVVWDFLKDASIWSNQSHKRTI